MLEKSISINKGGSICFNGDKRVYLDGDIGASLFLEELIIVVVFAVDKDIRDDNVYCYNQKGELVWKITPKSSGYVRPCPVTAIWIDNDKLIAYRGCGIEEEININDGTVMSYDFIK